MNYSRNSRIQAFYVNTNNAVYFDSFGAFLKKLKNSQETKI